MGEKKEFDLSLGVEAYPRFSPITYFVPPGLLAGQPRGAELEVLRVAYIDMGITYQKLKGKTTTRQYAINGPLALMIAKIAYCYAIARLGLDAFDGSEIRDLLQGRRTDLYNYVGGVPVLAPLASDATYLNEPIPFGAKFGLWTGITPPSRPSVPIIGNGKSPDLHELHLRQEGELQTVLVHLFASCRSMPPYQVVVGKSLSDSS